MTVIPTGSFIKRFLVFFFQEMAERCRSVSLAWQERPGLMLSSFIASLAIVTIQLLYYEGIWP